MSRNTCISGDNRMMIISLSNGFSNNTGTEGNDGILSGVSRGAGLKHRDIGMHFQLGPNTMELLLSSRLITSQRHAESFMSISVSWPIQSSIAQSMWLNTP